MRLNPGFYRDYLQWFTKRGQWLSEHSPEDLPQFLEDHALLFANLIETIESVPLKGKGLKLVGEFMAWIATHFDPLRPARSMMRAYQIRYNLPGDTE